MDIIAGPIVRHSNVNEINIWFVLDEKANTVAGKVIQNGQTIGANTAGSKAPVQMGRKLYAYLLKLVPAEGTFPLNKILNYDLEVNGQNLKSLGLTTGNRRISYTSGGLPGLLLKDKHSVILQGSCRKPHARRGSHTQPDMLVRADDLIAADRTSTKKRPSLLFLSGDQIYADDVAAPMLALIRKYAAEYIGGGDAQFGDALPHAGSKKRLSTFLLNGRDEFLSNKVKGFTSGYKENHLLSFGEYLMMYLLVWGGFDAKCPEYDEIESVIKKEVDPDEDEWHLDSTYPDYFRDMVVCNRFLENAWRVRRALANTVTYMMMDDHEVTDDWNLTEENQNALRDKPFGRHVQVNALAAFWVCQGWGNTPDAFPRQSFVSPVERYYNSYNETHFESCAKALLGQYWGFELDIDPITVVLDTRTRRSFNALGLARLMRPEVLAQHAQNIKARVSAGNGERTLLIVSSAPVYGFTATERIQLKAVENDRTMAYKLDAECWMADEGAFKQLQSVIVESGLTKCVIFSGDVHYGFCRHEMQVNAAGKEVDIYQFTSSSLHNSPGVFGHVGLDVLAVRESFKKNYSSYMLPQESDQKFLNQSTNIGVLTLAQGEPVNLFLDSSAPSGMKQRETVNWYGPENPEGFIWTYPLDKVKKLTI